MNGNLRSVLCVVCFAFAWGLFPVRQALRAQEPAVPADRLEGDLEAEPVVAVPESGAPVVESDTPETESVPEEMAGASEAWMEEMDEQEREMLWTVRASALYRGNMDVGIRGVSSAGAAPPIAGGNRAPAGIGGLGGYANRNYDNGFVYIDPGTAFPGTLIPGLTWYWGYRDGGQYNAAGETLRFTKAGGERFSQSVVRNQKLEFDEETEAPGFSLELSRDWKVMGLDSSVTLGFNGFWMDSVGYVRHVQGRTAAAGTLFRDVCRTGLCDFEHPTGQGRGDDIFADLARPWQGGAGGRERALPGMVGATTRLCT